MSTLPKPTGKHRRVPLASSQRPAVGWLAWVALGIAAVLLAAGAWIALAPDEDPYGDRLLSGASLPQPPVKGWSDSPSSRKPQRSFGGARSEPRPLRSMVEPDDPTGLALFPAPGTDPPKRGIIVPEDFELPPGYVRHYQATDSGERLPAILMFHPDHQPIDANGTPLRLPADRIVTPELAPPGLAVHMLEVPVESSEVP